MQTSEEYCSVFLQLKKLGVKIPRRLKKLKSSNPKQVRPILPCSAKIFGSYINEQEKLPIGNYLLPKFIVIATTYLKNFCNEEIGLFRKAGSVSRQKDLRAKLEKGESIEKSEPNDVASLLKQWLRELPEPLIPFYLQDLFVRSYNLQVLENRINAVFLCCHLLPVDHLHTLKYLLDFLAEIAKYSNKNKMDIHNLALVMAPNIFVMETDSIDKSSNDLVHQHMSIIELLINNVNRFDELPQCSSLHLLEAETLKCSSDLNSSTDILDCSPSKAKKRRSGPVQDLFTGLRKLVGQNQVSPNPTKRVNQDECKSAERSASKRKAETDQSSMSPFKKMASSPDVLHNEIQDFTPKNKSSRIIFGEKEKTSSTNSRRKSFGLLKRKEKKSRQKLAKCNVTTKMKLPSTPFPFQEKSLSFMDSSEIQETVLDEPIFSPLEFDKLFPKFMDQSSSEVLLHSQDCEKSPCDLTSDSKQVMEGKSDISNKVRQKACVKLAENNSETTGASYSSWFNEKSVKINPCSKRQSHEHEDLNLGVSTLSSRNDFDEADSLNSSQVLIQNNSQCKKFYPEYMEDKNICTLNNTDKLVNSKNLIRNDATDINCNLPTVTSRSNLNSVESCMPKKEVVKRKCSIKRQETIRIQQKNALNHLNRADSIKISKSRSSCVNHQISGLCLNGKSNEKNGADCATGVIEDKKVTSAASVEILDKNANINLISAPVKKRTRRNVRNGSIVRGRPNTVKTGLPPDACSRYNNESFSVNNRRQLLTSTSSIDNDLLLNIVDNSESNDHDMRLTLPNISLSSPKEEKCAINMDFKDVLSQTPVCIDSTETITNDDTETSVLTNITKINSVNRRSSTSRRKNRLCSSSDSKIHKMKTRSLKVSRINSLPASNMKHVKPRVTKKLRAVKSYSSQKSLGIEIINSVDIEKENVFIEESSQNKSEVTNMKDVKHREIKKLRSVKSSTPRKCLETEVSNFVEKENVFIEESSQNKSEDTNMKDVKHRDTKKLRSVKSSSPRKCLETEVSNLVEVEKEDVFIEESSQKKSDFNIRNINPIKTPEENVETRETWVSGRQFFEAEAGNKESISNKRESIALILRTHHGRVKATASMYDSRSATPGSMYYKPQYCNKQATQSEKRSSSVRNIRCTRRNFPLPPPPKFVIPESPSSPSYPLKELTNVSNSEVTVYSPSPVKKTPDTPTKDQISVEKLNKCLSMPKMNSYSGHTPYKLPMNRCKVHRSESSPLLQTSSKFARKAQEYSSQNSLAMIKNIE